MKAVRIHETGGVDVLKVEELPMPKPGNDEVLIKVDSAGINFADIMTRRGSYVNMPELPVTLGLEFAGTVEALGKNSRHLGLGDRVIATAQAGGYSEYAVAHSSMTIPLPHDVTYSVACALPVSAMTAYHLSHTVTHPSVGETAVVYAAAGSVGVFLCQLLKLRRANVIALVGSDEKAQKVRKFGADHVVVYTETSSYEKVLEMTDGRGADYIYNSVAGSTLSDDFKMIASLGTIVMFGQSAGPPRPKELYVAMMRAFMKSPALRMYYLTSSIIEHPKEHMEGWMRMFVWLQNGQIDVPIHQVYPLEDVASAHDVVEMRRSVGKVILKP
jgi:NADPH:quinone reductase